MGLNLKAFVQWKKPVPKWKGNILNGKKVLANIANRANRQLIQNIQIAHTT